MIFRITGGFQYAFQVTIPALGSLGLLRIFKISRYLILKEQAKTSSFIILSTRKQKIVKTNSACPEVEITKKKKSIGWIFGCYGSVSSMFHFDLYKYSLY